MSEVAPSFTEEINAHKSAETAPSFATHIDNGLSTLSVRHRGCFITDCELTSPLSGDKIDVLYSDPDTSVPKLTASHVMSPIGSNEGIGGQHGFARWTDYHKFALEDGPNGEKRVAFQAKRSDNGMSLAKAFELTDSTLVSHTTIYNSEPDPTQTCIGEHYYFTLQDEQSKGLKVNGKSLDELLGDGSEKNVMDGVPIFWESFDGEAIMDFPAGHSIKLSSEFAGSAYPGLGMLIWHRPGSPSICFEPTVGFNSHGQKDGIGLLAYTSATLSTKIELL